MKILFVNEYIYPNVVSGAEFSMQALAESLGKKGENVIFFGPNLSKKRINFYKKIKILRFPFPKKILPYKALSPFWFNNPFFWLYSAIFLIFVCLKEKIDLIHVHGKYILPAAVIAKIFLKRSIVVTIRDYKFLCPLSLCLIKQGKICSWNYFLSKEIKFYLLKYEKRKKLIAKISLTFRITISKLLQEILLRFLKSTNQIVCVSKAVLDIYKKNEIDEAKLIKIYNLPPIEMKTSKAVFGERIILSVGKLSFGKGTDILIKAMEKVREKIPEVKLILVGKKSSSIDSLPEFIFHYPRIPHEKIKKFYKKASLFVLSSRWPEPLSRAALEALSFGLPLILSNKGGNREVVEDGVNGYLVSLKPEELAQKILLILKNEKRAMRMGQASHRILNERFNKEKIIEEHLEIYRKLSLRHSER